MNKPSSRQRIAQLTQALLRVDSKLIAFNVDSKFSSTMVDGRLRPETLGTVPFKLFLSSP